MFCLTFQHLSPEPTMQRLLPCASAVCKPALLQDVLTKGGRRRWRRLINVTGRWRTMRERSFETFSNVLTDFSCQRNSSVRVGDAEIWQALRWSHLKQWYRCERWKMPVKHNDIVWNCSKLEMRKFGKHYDDHIFNNDIAVNDERCR